MCLSSKVVFRCAPTSARSARKGSNSHHPRDTPWHGTHAGNRMQSPRSAPFQQYPLTGREARREATQWCQVKDDRTLSPWMLFYKHDVKQQYKIIVHLDDVILHISNKTGNMDTFAVKTVFSFRDLSFGPKTSSAAASLALVIGQFCSILFSTIFIRSQVKGHPILSWIWCESAAYWYCTHKVYSSFLFATEAVDEKSFILMGVTVMKTSGWLPKILNCSIWPWDVETCICFIAVVLHTTVLSDTGSRGTKC